MRPFPIDVTLHVHMKLIVFVVGGLLSASPLLAQAVGGAEQARPVAGDPGVSSMLVTTQPQFRVLRDYAEPGAVRRIHSHDDATWHVFVLVTGQLTLTIEGENPVDVTQGQVLTLKGGAKHTFKNTGSVTATIVEVFGRSQQAAEFAAAIAAATSPSSSPCCR
ncbi:MAG TPA: cupin domain-containing protein [Vicinamibacterales bacterium]